MYTATGALLLLSHSRMVRSETPTGELTCAHYEHDSINQLHLEWGSACNASSTAAGAARIREVAATPTQHTGITRHDRLSQYTHAQYLHDLIESHFL